MATVDAFLQRVKSILGPELTAAGFTRRFPSFRRFRGELIHEVQVQGWRHGGARTVNLCFGFAFLQPSYANPTAPEMEYSYRIGTHTGSDKWWRYASASETEAVALADEMIAVYRTEAPAFFERFKEFPGSFTHFSPEDLVEAPLSYLPPRIGGGRNVARDCWVFMHLWRHLGDWSRARAFARIGSQHIGEAKALEANFLQFLGSCP